MRAADGIDDFELQRLREMTASEKVAVMHSLWRQAWALKASGVRAMHPEWPPEEVDACIRSLFAGDAG